MWVFLSLVCNIKVSVAASYVIEKCRTDVLASVFCDTREIMESQHNEGWLRNSAVSLVTPSNPSYCLSEEPNVFKNNVWNIYSASPELCIFFVFKIRQVLVYTMFLT